MKCDKEYTLMRQQHNNIKYQNIFTTPSITWEDMFLSKSPSETSEKLWISLGITKLWILNSTCALIYIDLFF